MRIAILSLILNTNYGGILQAYALQTVLERMGHRVKVLDHDFVPRLPLRARLRHFSHYIFKKYILRKDTKNTGEWEVKRQRYLERSKHTRSFIFHYIHLRRCNSLTRISRFEFDAFVVGSDQVWRPKYFCCWGNIRDAYLHFARKWNVKRISYAASFGTEQWEYSETETNEAQQLLSLFDAVSVREFEGVYLCQKHLGTEACHVLDPTLLLQASDYESLISNSENILPTMAANSLFCYFLDATEEKKDFAEKMAFERHLALFCLNETESISSDLVRQPVEAWLRAFRDSQFVVTDSYHACLFSILFKKPFLCLTNKQRGLSRFNTIASMPGMQFHFISDINSYDSTCEYTPSPQVYKELEQRRSYSFEFLKTNLAS